MSAAVLKERGIIFGPESVRAILDERKTQTRRVIQPQPFKPGEEWSSKTVTQAWNSGFVDQPCPYGNEGTRLWVRETWAEYERQSEEERGPCGGKELNPFVKIIYRADYKKDPRQYGGGWRPPIFMKREYCRLVLEVTGVSVERLREITTEGIAAEGIEGLHPLGGAFPNQWREQFARGWNRINGRRKKCAWEDNPWVWVVAFRRVKE